MKRILYLTTFILCLLCTLLFTKYAVDKYKAIPYKIQVNSYQKVTYQEAYLIFLQREAQIQRTPLSANFDKLVNSLKKKEAQLFDTLSKSPYRIENIQNKVVELHQELEILRDLQQNKFKGLSKDSVVTRPFMLYLKEFRDKDSEFSFIPNRAKNEILNKLRLNTYQNSRT